MKKILLIILLLIVGCSKEPEPKPINLEILEGKKIMVVVDGEVGELVVYYTKDTNEPYTGAVFELYENGEKSVEGYLKDGKEDGKWISYSENGKIRTETNKKDGLRVKITYYNEDGSIESVKEW